ncbi:MAG TPA: hypothetical protein VNF06_02475, partial [Candidatus Aquilonibacter sp.]|nr:hypothetical protein [Candidatus Aquilonibacter sp.]
MSFLLPAFIALLSIVVPGFFLALALLGKTKLNKLEIGVMGFTFGLLFPPAMIWLESYLIPYMPAFAFSVGLYNLNVIILSIIGIGLCLWQGLLNLDLIKPFLGMKVTPKAEHTAEPHLSTETAVHENPEERQKKGQNSKLIWYLLVILMLVAFVSRIMSLPTAAHFFEFDPYFDLLSTSSILVHGYQVLYDYSAWPALVAGSPHRIEPIIPYLEAYWYGLSTTNLSQLSTTLLSNTSSFYPPIVAALLVFVVFMFLYHEYGEFPAIIGAILAASMPALITTFIAGEQLLEPIGIFTLFFFYAAYLLAVNNMKEKRFAILAGIAFVSTFLTAHYYTVDAGVLAIYILLQGIIFVLGNKTATFGVIGGFAGLVAVASFAGISILAIAGFVVGLLVAIFLAVYLKPELVDWKIEKTMDFYKMNLIVIAIIAVFYELFAPYGSVLTNRTPTILHVPIIFGFALFAL